MSRSPPRVMLSKIVQGWSGRSRGYHGCWKNLFISLLSSFLLTSHSSLLFDLFFIIFLSIHSVFPPFGSIVLSSFSPKYSRNDELFYTSPSSRFVGSCFALILINVLNFFKLEVDHTSFLFCFGWNCFWKWEGFSWEWWDEWVGKGCKPASFWVSSHKIHRGSQG